MSAESDVLTTGSRALFGVGVSIDVAHELLQGKSVPRAVLHATVDAAFVGGFAFGFAAACAPETVFVASPVCGAAGAVAGGRTAQRFNKILDEYTGGVSLSIGLFFSAVTAAVFMALAVAQTVRAWSGRAERRPPPPVWWPLGDTLWREYPCFQTLMGPFAALYLLLALGFLVGGSLALFAFLIFSVGFIVLVALILLIAYRGRPVMLIPPIYRKSRDGH